jgi:hypothetical protein
MSSEENATEMEELGDRSRVEIAADTAQSASMARSFDSEAVDALVQQLGREILCDPFYRSEPWDQLALVINLDQRKQMFGYVYSAGDWEAACPDGVEPLETAGKLQQAMRLPDSAPWKKCLVTIDRGTAKIDIDFDYDGTEWIPDMADPERFALGLNPVCAAPEQHGPQ